MDIETLEKANEIMRSTYEVEKELKAWGKVNHPTDLGMVYQKRLHDSHYVELPCEYTPVAAFNAYREACINALKVRHAEFLAELAAL